jgi:hypothetical protein
MYLPQPTPPSFLFLLALLPWLIQRETEVVFPSWSLVAKMCGHLRAQELSSPTPVNLVPFCCE